MNAKLYYTATAGQALSAMTLTLGGVKNVDVKLSTGEADVTTRANSGWKQNIATLKECEISFDLPLDPSDAGYIAVRAAFMGGTLLGFAALTGDKAVSGNEGIVGDFTVTEFTRSEPIEEAQSVSVTAKLYTFKEWAVTAETDATAPTVVTVPADAATGIVVSANLTATFDAAINPDDVTAGNFVLVKAEDGTVTAGALSYNGETFVVTFDPTASLTASKAYVWIISNVRDLAGNKAAPTVVNFTTA
jgi:hypothetical protein